jgi:hypothetical protein
MLLQQTVKYVLKAIRKLKEKPDSLSLLNFVNDVISNIYRILSCLNHGRKMTFYQSTPYKKFSENVLSEFMTKLSTI